MYLKLCKVALVRVEAHAAGKPRILCIWIGVWALNQTHIHIQEEKWSDHLDQSDDSTSSNHSNTQANLHSLQIHHFQMLFRHLKTPR